jgi:hypothetical protein
MFDGIIEQYDCYKVESVGDDTLVASGLPRRNGIQVINLSDIFYPKILACKGDRFNVTQFYERR